MSPSPTATRMSTYNLEDQVNTSLRCAFFLPVSSWDALYPCPWPAHCCGCNTPGLERQILPGGHLPRQWFCSHILFPLPKLQHWLSYLVSQKPSNYFGSPWEIPTVLKSKTRNSQLEKFAFLLSAYYTLGCTISILHKWMHQISQQPQEVDLFIVPGQ